MSISHPRLTPAQMRERRARRLKIINGVECPQCHAPAGQPCGMVFTRGYRLSPHLSRIEAWRELQLVAEG